MLSIRTNTFIILCHSFLLRTYISGKSVTAQLSSMGIVTETMYQIPKCMVLSQECAADTVNATQIYHANMWYFVTFARGTAKKGSNVKARNQGLSSMICACMIDLV